MEWIENLVREGGRRLAESGSHPHSSSFYYQPEGGLLSGNGVLEDTLSRFMVQVSLLMHACVEELEGVERKMQNLRREI